MKIKITTSCSGINFSYREGQTVEVDKTLGEDLLKCGFAEEVKATVKRDTKPKTEIKNTSGDVNAGT